MCPCQISRCSHTAGSQGPYSCSHFPSYGFSAGSMSGVIFRELDLGLIPAVGEDKDAGMAHFSISLLNYRGQCGIPVWQVSTSRATGSGNAVRRGRPSASPQHTAPAPCRGVAQLPGVHSRVPISGRLLHPGCKYQP